MTPADGTPRSAPSQVRSYLGVFFATALWASSGIFVNLIMKQSPVSAPALAFYRDLGTFVLLLCGMAFFRPRLLRVERRDIKWLFAMGGLSIGTFHVLWNLSVMLNGVAVATVQQSVSPVFVTIVAWIVWREPLTRRKILAVILAFVGTVLVSGLDVLGTTRLTTAGIFAGVGMAVFYGAFSLFGKQIAGDYHPLTVLTYAFGFATLALTPLQFFVPQPWPMPAMGLVYLAGLILLPTIVGFTAYVTALRGLQASVASILAMAEIPIAYLYSYVLLGERLSLSQIAGALLTVAGVLMLSWSGWRSASTRTESGMAEEEAEGSGGQAVHGQEG